MGHVSRLLNDLLFGAQTLPGAGVWVLSGPNAWAMRKVEPTAAQASENLSGHSSSHLCLSDIPP